MQTSEDPTKAWMGILKVQQALRTVEHDSKNNHFRSRYATLAACLRTVVPVLSDAGCIVVQPLTRDGELLQVHTRIVHAESGAWVGATFSAPTVNAKGPNDLQAAGITVSYLRRYSLLSLLGIATADDSDGEAQPSPPAPSKQYADGNLARTGLKQEDAEKLVGAPFAQWGQAHVPTLRKLAETLRGARAVGVQESNSRPGTYHLQYTRGSGTLCTCEHFTHKGTCRHVKEQ